MLSSARVKVSHWDEAVELFRLVDWLLRFSSVWLWEFARLSDTEAITIDSCFFISQTKTNNYTYCFLGFFLRQPRPRPLKSGLWTKTNLKVFFFFFLIFSLNGKCK